MGIEQSFNDIVDFLDKIIPAFILHLLLLLLLRRYPIVNINFRHKIVEYINSNKHEETRKILKEFELWNKIPYFFLVLALIYFHFFSSISWAFMSTAPNIVTPGYSTGELWKENGRAYIREIVSLDTLCFNNNHSIDVCRGNLINKYKIENNELYEKSTGWSKQQTDKWLGYYTQTFGLTCLIIIYFIYYLLLDFRKKTNLISRKNTINFLFLTLVLFLGLVYCRYKYEFFENSTFVDENRFLMEIANKGINLNEVNEKFNSEVDATTEKVIKDINENTWGSKMWFY